MLYVSATTTEKKPEFYKKLLDRAMGYVKKGVVAGFPRGVLNTPHYKNEDGSMGKSIIDVAISNNYGIGVPQRDFMTPASKRWKKFFFSLQKRNRTIKEYTQKSLESFGDIWSA